eukprot:2325775-Lingulodinium_polyedra.AAC.1
MARDLGPSVLVPVGHPDEIARTHRELMAGVARVTQLRGRRELDDPIGGPREDALGERVAKD